MKILFDCIVTASPERCSTTVQFVTLAERLLKHPDVFIYWPIPDRLEPEELEFYPDDVRIKYFPIPQSKDRLREYNRIVPEFENLLAFNGSTWDWDVLVTVRSTQVPMMRVISNSPRTPHRASHRRIVLIEDMMILSKKPTVAQSNVDVQDRLTIEAYLAADKVLMPAYHQLDWVMSVARKHFTPARLKDLRGRVSEVCHLNMPTYKLKTSEQYPKEKLGVAFVERLGKHDARLKDLNAAFTKQYILYGDGIDSFVCTVSKIGGCNLFHESVEVLRPDRSKFWELCQTRMGVALSLHRDVELNMSLLEPLAFGVPLIVAKAPWSIAMVGKDYPFFCSGVSQMFGLISAFRKDYASLYAKFSRWFEDWFVPTYEKRRSEQGLYNSLEELCTTPTYGTDGLSQMCKDILVRG